MMHVNQYDGLPIDVSEVKFITRVARRTVLSDNAMSVLVPVMEEVLRWDSVAIRRFFATRGLTLREWDKMSTDMLTIDEISTPAQAAVTQYLRRCFSERPRLFFVGCLFSPLPRGRCCTWSLGFSC